MKSYFVAQIKMHDENEYKKYLDACDEIFAKYNGKYLAVDNNPCVLEGKWSHDRIVMIEFPCEEDLRQWYESSEYQAIVKHRLKGAKCDTLLINGL